MNQPPHCVHAGHTLTFRLGLSQLSESTQTPHSSLSRNFLPITPQVWLSHPYPSLSLICRLPACHPARSESPPSSRELRCSLTDGESPHRVLPVTDFLEKRNEQNHQSTLSASRLRQCKTSFTRSQASVWESYDYI